MLRSGPHVPQPGWQHIRPCLAFWFLPTVWAAIRVPWVLVPVLLYIYMQNLLGALTSSPGFHPLAYPGLGSALSSGPGWPAFIVTFRFVLELEW